MPPTGDLREDPIALADRVGQQTLDSLYFWCHRVLRHIVAARDGRNLHPSEGVWMYDLARACTEVTTTAAVLGAEINLAYPPTSDTEDEEEKSDEDMGGTDQSGVETEHAPTPTTSATTDDESSDDDAPGPVFWAPGAAAADDDVLVSDDDSSDASTWEPHSPNSEEV